MPDPTDRDHSEIATRYAQGVLSGAIPAGGLVKLACKRQLDDLERAEKGWAYHFNPGKANRICDFIERLPHIKGSLAGKMIHLEPWQSFVVSTVFGWQTEAGLRRFRRTYTEVPRGNGKSTLSSPIGLYMLTLDGEPGAEVYSCATSRDQAKIVHVVAQHMARKSPEFRAKCGVEVLAHSIVVPKTASKFEACSAEGNTLDGLNTHCAIIDELHAHKTRIVYDVMETSIGKRDQSMLWVITTSGSNRSGICYEVRDFVSKVLHRVGGTVDESQFGIIYSIDEGDDWQSEDIWKKANPNWAVSVRPEVIGQLAAKAMQMPAAQSNFKTKHLDVWVSSDAPLFNVEAWDALGDANLSESDFEGEPCIMGLDLATREDLTARAKVFSREGEDGKAHYYVFMNHYLPELALTENRNSQYSGWELTGRITATPGNTLDFSLVEDEILDDSSRFQVDEIAFDPWQAAQIAQRLGERGATMVEVRKTVPNLSEPTKELGALILDGRIHHDGDPVLSWEISNVVGHVDLKDNVWPKKERPENKIDGVVAMIMALSRWIRHDASDSALSAHYANEGISTL